MRRKSDPGVQYSDSELMAILARIAILFLFFLPSNTVQAQQWVAPLEANDLVNPIPSDANSLAMGKAFFTTICFVCHGDGGKGDGINAPSLERQPADLTSADVQKQSDGALFWKISEGNAPMLTFKDVLSEEQRWQLVNYIRTLAADKPPATKSNTVASAEVVEVPVINLYAGQTEVISGPNINTTTLQPADSPLEKILARALTISIFLVLLYVVLLLGKTYHILYWNLVKRD